MDDFITYIAVDPIRSPCINVCEIDRATRLCRGCLRTIDEVAQWSSGTPRWRDAVMAALPGRRGSG